MRPHPWKSPPTPSTSWAPAALAGRKTHALNVSTMACFVAAGAGATVCKHGNVKASSTSGSFDLLEAIGLPMGQSPEQVAEAVRTAGLGFALAKTFHPAMRHVAGVRSQVGIPTVFNLLGPLSHPGHAKRQVIGVPEESLAPRHGRGAEGHRFRAVAGGAR